MRLTPMRYKDYIWPHNPATYSITYERQVAVHKVPFGRYCMQDLGLGCRIMRGQGEFSGKDAYGEFKRLASIFYSGGPGLLIHPLWQISNAYFTSWNRNRVRTMFDTALNFRNGTTGTMRSCPHWALPVERPPPQARAPGRKTSAS